MENVHLLLQPAMTTWTSTAACSLMTCGDEGSAFNITPSKSQARSADRRPPGGSRNLLDGFGSHGVDEADGRPVQDDGVNGAGRLRYQGLLQSVLQPTVPLLVLRGDVSEDLVGHSLLVKLNRLGGKGFIRLLLKFSPYCGETQR